MLRATSLFMLAAGAGGGVAGLQLKMNSSNDYLDWFPVKTEAPAAGASTGAVPPALDFVEAAGLCACGMYPAINASPL